LTRPPLSQSNSPRFALLATQAGFSTMATSGNRGIGRKESNGTMIIVTGANGKLGREIVDHLLQRRPPEQVGASVRDLAKAVVEIMLSLYHAARAGEFVAVDPTLSTLIGRAPVSVRDILAAQLPASTEARQRSS
jgi:hypothetical protein